MMMVCLTIPPLPKTCFWQGYPQGGKGGVPIAEKRWKVAKGEGEDRVPTTLDPGVDQPHGADGGGGDRRRHLHRRAWDAAGACLDELARFCRARRRCVSPAAPDRERGASGQGES